MKFRVARTWRPGQGGPGTYLKPLALPAFLRTKGQRRAAWRWSFWGCRRHRR